MSAPLRHYRESVLDILPEQGQWNDEIFLAISDNARRLVELTDGQLEVLPMPTRKHQAILLFLYRQFFVVVQECNGRVYVAPLRLRIRPGKFREPDLLLVRSAADPRMQDRFWTGADLVLEVVSPDGSNRDLIIKRSDYAEGRIPEYWVVNPLNETITVYRLEGKRYVKHGQFRRGQKATSALLKSFAVDVNEVFDAD